MENVFELQSHSKDAQLDFKSGFNWATPGNHPCLFSVGILVCFVVFFCWKIHICPLRLVCYLFFSSYAFSFPDVSHITVWRTVTLLLVSLSPALFAWILRFGGQPVIWVNLRRCTFVVLFVIGGFTVLYDKFILYTCPSWEFWMPLSQICLEGSFAFIWPNRSVPSGGEPVNVLTST